MPVDNLSMHFAIEQVDASHQAYRPMTNILIIPRHTGLFARHGGQVRRGIANCLNTWLLIIGQNSHHGGNILSCFTQQRNFFVYVEDLGHLLFELLITPLQIVADLVRSNLVLRQNLRHGTTRQLQQAGMPSGLTVFLNMFCQKTRRPQLVRVAEVLWLLTGKIDNPYTSLFCDCARSSRSGKVIQRGHHTQLKRLVNTPFHSRSVGAHRPGNRGNRFSFRISKKHLSPFHSSRRFCTGTINRGQLRFLIRGQYQFRSLSLKRHGTPSILWFDKILPQHGGTLQH